MSCTSKSESFVSKFSIAEGRKVGGYVSVLCSFNLWRNFSKTFSIGMKISLGLIIFVKVSVLKFGRGGKIIFIVGSSGSGVTCLEYM